MLGYGGAAFVRVAEAAQAKWTDIWVGGMVLVPSAWRRWPVRSRRRVLGRPAEVAAMADAPAMLETT